MNFQDNLSLVPIVIGIAIGILALFGTGELLKEASIAFKKGVKA